MAEFHIAVVAGDGIGPEVTEQAIAVLNKIGDLFHHTFHFNKVLAGGCAIDEVGKCLPAETLCAVRGPKWDTVAGVQRPEKALLGLREGLGLYANLRPAIIHKALSDACPLKPEITGDGIDILIVRELTGGIYFGEKGYREGKYGQEAFDIEAYSEMEIRRIAKNAFDVAMQRNKKVTSVEKANV